MTLENLCGYGIKNNKLSTGKIGSRQFRAVVCPAYLLYEFYTKEFGIAERDSMTYMLRETFYDFLFHPEDPKRQATVVLLRRLVERGKTELPLPNSDNWLAWHEKRFSPARQWSKLHLAILGNLELKKSWNLKRIFLFRLTYARPIDIMELYCKRS